MRGGDGRGRVGFARREGAQQVAMIARNTREALLAVAVAVPQGGDQHPMLIDDRHRLRMIGGRVDRLMEKPVAPQRRRVIAGGDTSFAQPLDLAEPGKQRCVRPRGGTPRQDRLECAARLEQGGDEAAIDAAHARATARLHVHEALAGKPAQRLADRHVTGAVAGRHLLHRDPRPEWKRAGGNVVSNLLSDVR